MIIDKYVLPKLSSNNISVTNELVGNEINQWHIHNPNITIEDNVSSTTPLVMLHGYLTSSMCYYKNIPELSKKFRDIYLLDLPGHGGTPLLPHISDIRLNYERPLPLKYHFIPTKDSNGKKLEFEIDFPMEYPKYRHLVDTICNTVYADTIEQWKFDSKIKGKINLVAHSFGGYVSFKYWFKYPKSVNKIVLASPLGMERNIFSINNLLHGKTKYPLNYRDPSSKYYLNPNVKVPRWLFNNQYKIFEYLGPLGAKILWAFINKRYSRQEVEFRNYLFDQMYYMDCKKQELNLSVLKELFTPFLTAIDPILDYKIPHHKLLVLFGDHDWMNRSESGRFVENSCIIPRAGHNLFLDNPEKFNEKVIEFLNN
ncbi:related to Protein ECM18 [Saccharomycodes ludwigii]|uniref:Related to Protein ECM18 n=1 Tax=Saccharomycodes ludwigii TaxID=36035 RepID=A0A376B5K9_9ASCO|nr:related to Protein ECM18 [Saccharomycodes ludwigii]